MLQKIIVASFVMLFVFTGTCFAFNRQDHIDALEKMWEVPRIYGGLGKKIPFNDLGKVQDLTDQFGKGGKGHRHNGSHNKKTVLKLNKLLIKSYKWDKWALGNAICIHNIMDMAHVKSKGGTNGWKVTPAKQKEAWKLYEDKIVNGKKILSFPKWAKKPGPMMKVSDSYKEFCKFQEKKGVVTKPKPKKKISKMANSFVKKLKFDQVFKKVSVVVKRVPYAGPIIYVTYEGVTFIHRTKDGDINLEKEISNAISTTVGFGFAVMGTKVGAVICAPLEAVPIAGPVLHIVGTITVAVGCGFTGNYITEQSIQYIKITYI